MIEQLIKDNTEAMRELIAVLRSNAVMHLSVNIPERLSPIEENAIEMAEEAKKAAVSEAKKPEPVAAKPTVQQDKPKTRAEIQAAMIKLCQTPEGKETARKALQAVGKARFSEVADDQLDIFVSHLVQG